jgi:hypothetical protein
MAKKAMIRASSPGLASSSFGAGPDRNIARRMDVLMRRSRIPILTCRIAIGWAKRYCPEEFNKRVGWSRL